MADIQDRSRDLPDMLVNIQRATADPAPDPAATTRFLGARDQLPVEDEYTKTNAATPATIVTTSLGAVHELLAVAENVTLTPTTPGAYTWGAGGTMVWDMSTWG